MKSINVIDEICSEITTCHQQSLIDGAEGFECLSIVEKLLGHNLITWDMHHLFISEERSCGPIHGVIHNGVFKFAFQETDSSQTYTLENDIYLTLSSLINFILGIK